MVFSGIRKALFRTLEKALSRHEKGFSAVPLCLCGNGVRRNWLCGWELCVTPYFCVFLAGRHLFRKYSVLVKLRYGLRRLFCMNIRKCMHNYA